MRSVAILALLLVACGTATKPSAVDPRTGTAAISAGSHGQGVAITEGGSYGDRHDPSGWSGTTTPPKAVGGGPAPAAEPTAEPKTPPPQSSASTAAEPPKAAPKAPAKTPALPKATEPKKPSPAPAASSVPPSKDLDVSPPPKDLQF